MKKRISFLVCCVFSTNFLLADIIAPQSRLEKVKTALTSKEAKITYGVLGLVASGACAYFVIQGKRLAGRFDVLDTISGQYDLAQEYDLSYRALENENFRDNNNAFNIVISARTIEDEPKLWRLAKDGQHASWFTKNKIKVTPVVKVKKVTVIIYISKSK